MIRTISRRRAYQAAGRKGAAFVIKQLIFLYKLEVKLTRYNLGITMDFMKVAISLPDQLFDAAELLADELNVSRSQLYARALSEFIDRRDGAAITEKLNAVYALESSEIDPMLEAMNLEVLRRETW